MGDKKREGRAEEEKGIEAELKARRRWSPRELGMEGKRVVGGRGGEGGKVWKLADRIGYAQTESQAQAQT